MGQHASLVDSEPRQVDKQGGFGRTYWTAPTQLKSIVVTFLAAQPCFVSLDFSRKYSAAPARASFLAIGAALWLVLVDIFFNVCAARLLKETGGSSHLS